MNRYIAFDVETPNSRNDRISALGVTALEDGRITGSWYTLVDPQTHFDPFNIALTGITPEMVKGQPTFPQLWPKLRPLMESGLLIAHNAPFDMGVLRKCLIAYNILWKPTVPYACTVRMGRACFPRLPNHKLNTLCDCLDITLDHHNAGSDSQACAILMQEYLARGLDIRPFIRQYDISLGKTLPVYR